MTFNTISKAYDLMEENKFLGRLSRSTSLPSSTNTNKLALTNLYLKELELENEKMNSIYEDFVEETNQLKEIIKNLQLSYKRT